MRSRFILFSLFITVAAQSQNLRLADIQAMLKCSTWSDVNVKLINKGWTYSTSVVSADPRESVITWSYKENIYTEKAQGWFYLVTYDNVPAKARYQPSEIEVYNSILNGVVSSGYKLSSSQVLDNQILSKYESSTWIVTFIKSKEEEGYVLKTYNYVDVVEKGTHYDPDNGPFEVMLADSVIMKATTKERKLEGDCKFYGKNGLIIREGKFKNGLRQGKWFDYEYDQYGQKTATFYKNYKDDIENGEFYLPLVVGTQRGTYVNGKKQGTLEEYNDKGQLTFKTTMTADSVDGISYYYTYDALGICNDTMFATYKMGALDGPFENWHGDEYIEGSFVNDQLNGYCKIYKNEDVLLGDLKIPGRMFFINAEGTYSYGKRVGLWKEYSYGNLRAEGNYVNGKKSGPWQFYATQSKFNHDVEEVITYKNDLRNGPCKSNFELDLVPCADSSPGCFEYQKTPNTIEGNFLNDLADGVWTKKDSTGKILWSGSYILDKKTGQWKYNEYGEDGENYTTVVNYKSGREEGKTSTTSSTRGVLWEANYVGGKFSGLMLYYFPGNPGLDQCTMNYVAGEISGSYSWTDRSGNEISGAYYRNRISSCVVTDSSGKQLYSLEQIVLIGGTKYSSLYTIETDSGSVAQQITYDIGVSYDSLMPYLFLWKFMNERDDLRLAHSGTYSLTKDGVTLASGQKINGVKSGQWTYKYNSEVSWSVTYKDGVVVDEYFFTAGGAFSGKYRATYPGGIESVMFKVEESKRDGKSEYMRNGKVYRTEKYKKGVIQN